VAELLGVAADAETLQRRSIQRDESDRALSSNGDDADTTSDRRQQGRPSSGEGLRESGSVRYTTAVANAQHGGRQGRDSEWRGPETANAPRRWLPEPDVGRVAHGVPRRVDRLRTLGNAVVPQVVEEIGRAIMLSV
jgi:DNA (cytosine-5)-methyltransferase 1